MDEPRAPLGDKTPNTHLGTKRPFQSDGALAGPASKHTRFDLGDLEEEVDTRGVSIGTDREPEPESPVGAQTPGEEDAEDCTLVTLKMFDSAVQKICKTFPQEEDEIREFLGAGICEDDPAPTVEHMNRHQLFRQVVVAVSGMPDEDIPWPSGEPHFTRLGWQLNHPTERCTEKPGWTLDMKSPTARGMMVKGVNKFSSFTYDTINRRALIRRVQHGGKLVRNRETELKFWSAAHQEVHHEYVRWIWEHLPFKVNLVCDGENRELMIPMMGLKVQRLWCRATGPSKIAFFIWQREYILRSRRVLRTRYRGSRCAKKTPTPTKC